MKKFNLFFSIMLAFVFSGLAQNQLNTVPPLNGGNGSGGTAFQLIAKSTVRIDSLLQAFQAQTQSPEIWYTTTDTVGPPNITTANGWTLIATSPSLTGQSAGLTPTLQTIPVGLNLVLTPGIYRFYIGGSTGTSVVYTTWNAANQDVYSDNFITIKNGQNIGYGGAIPNPNFSPRQWNGGVIYSPVGGLNDAAVLSVDSPSAFCAGTHNVVATIANFGSNQIDSVDVNWSVGGVAQTPVKYIGLLDTIGGTNPSSASVSLGSAMFAAGSTNIIVYTSNPNGMMDTTNFNDTANVTVTTASPPTSITTLNATLNSIDVQAAGVTGTIEYEYGPVGFAPGTGTTGSAASSPFTITGLSQGTAYDVYVRSNCGGGDVSAYVGPSTFNTSYGVPFLQDFENYTAGLIGANFPEGWSTTRTTDPNWESEQGTGNNANSFGTGPLWDHTNFGSSPGMYMYMETSGGTVGDSVDLISPPIYVDTALSTIEVGYWYFNFGPNIDRMEVYVDTNGVEMLLATYLGAQQAAQTDPWGFASHTLTGYQGKSIQLKFRGFNVNCCSGDIAVDDITVDPVLPLNTGVVEIQSPSGNLCAGTIIPVVGVENFGSNVIDSVLVVANINGVIDTVNYVGTILPGDTASVSLNSLTISSSVIYDIDLYTILPNGMMDQFSGDDTLRVTGLRTGLSGNYTLDATQPSSSTNLSSFSELEQVINSYGVCGSTVVDVAAGTYVDALYFDNPPGMSATNNLTIDGGDSSFVTLENDLSTDDAILRFANASYITVKNMTIRSTRTGGGDHAGIHFSRGSSYDSIVGVRVEMDPNSTFGAMGIAASGTPTNDFAEGDNANHVVVMNSSVEGGDYSVHFEGPGGQFGTGWNVGNKFINNTLTNMDDYAFYFDDQDTIEIRGNVVRGMRTTSTFTGYGIFSSDCMNFLITANDIIANYRGISMNNTNSAKSPDSEAEISNNMLSVAVNSGIYTQAPFRVNFFNNSVYSTSNNSAAVYLDDGFGTIAFDSLDFRNNALYSTGTFALQMDEPDSTFIKFDNNAFHTDATDLLNIDGATYADLAAYQTAQPAFNAFSLDGDPQFISATDLHVVGNFINDAGDSTVAINVDIDGEVRPSPLGSTVDIGADEFDPPACPPSTGLGVTNVTLTSADIFWTGNIGSYEYVVVLQDSAISSGTTVTTSIDSFTVSGLMSSTSYDFYVREICGRGDTSIWVGPINFNTANGVPYFEDFETFTSGLIGPNFPRGWFTTRTTDPNWESEQGTGNNANSFGTGPLWDHTNFAVSPGIYMYMETSGGTVGDSADFVSPPIFVGAASAAITIEYWYFNFGPNIDRMEVIVDTNGVENVIATITGAQQAAQTDPWLQGSHTVAGYAGKSIQIKFRGFNVNCCSGDIAVDDVRVFEPSAQDGGVTDILTPTSGCALGATDTVTVEISNFGTANLTNFPVSYEVNGAAPVTETFTGTITPGTTANFAFSTTVNLSAFGNYNIVSYTNVTGDGDLTNDTSDIDIVNIPIISGFPYVESFETGNGGWNVAGNSSFALGTPNGVIIDTASDGTQAWVTNLTGTYNTNESGWVESPCLDFSTLVAPTIEMDIWYDSEFSWDGAVLQSSIDGGTTWQKVGALGDPDNWYTDNTINGLATLEATQEGWTGTGATSSGGWVTAKNNLTGLGGVSGVILRVAFGSDGSVVDEGFAFDDVRISEALADDVTMVEITPPVTGAYVMGSTDSLRIRVANVGSDTANAVPVNYSLNGGAVQTETIAQILPGDTVDYTFVNSVITLPAPGVTDVLDVYTSYTADLDNTNDSILGYQIDNLLKTVPYIEDFESLNPGLIGANFPNGWSTSRTTDPNWESEQGTGVNANSFGTGPLWDNTNFSVSPGIYMYMETSGGIAGDSADLITPSILVGSANDTLELEYYYFNFGTLIDRMEVLIDTNGTEQLIRTYTGAQQTAQTDPWLLGKDTLRGYAGHTIKIIFRGFNVNCCDGDIAIDDVAIRDITIGVDEVSQDALSGVNIFPNPSTGLFNLRINSEKTENYNLTVRDVSGKLVYESNVNVNGSYNDELDFTDFAKGVYYMQIQTETESRVEKLVIQ